MASKITKQTAFILDGMKVTYPVDDIGCARFRMYYRESDVPGYAGKTWWIERKDMRDFKDWIRDCLNDRN